MSSATTEKETQAKSRRLDRNQAKTVEMEAPAVQQEAANAPDLHIDAEGIGQIDRYLMIVGQSEEAGIVDYKSAFHNLVNKLRQQVKSK